MKKGLKAILVILIAGLLITIEFFRKESDSKSKAYDNLQRKYDTLILEKSKVLEESKLKRDSIIRINDSLTLRYEAIIQSLKDIPKPKKFDNLTNKELENLMIEEFKQFTHGRN